ncbi:MAG: class I SAM-dependent methyltransferase [Beijerinckiaceae bacterium]|nr:class I SAM-dependent methyltransferase [Beijerinckiaceae bacterium]
MTGFDDPATVARYTENPPRLVPGFLDLLRMTRLLLAETAPANARILVVGAGGGLELRAFAQAQPDWTFVGVDPSAEMLKLAGRTLGPLADRVAFHYGYMDSAPDGPFDGACCLLTMHFVPAEERVAMLSEIRRRLKPGTHLVVAHHSIVAGQARARWLARFAAFAADHGVDISPAAAERLGQTLSILTPDTEVAQLQRAGFDTPELFYAAFSFRGWVAAAR